MDFHRTSTDATVLRELGARIARHRLNRDWTQRRLAAEAGVSLPTVSRLERGESAGVTNLVRVLRALELLRNLSALVPEIPVSPVQQLRAGRAARQRASGKANDGRKGVPWSWGESR